MSAAATVGKLGRAPADPGKAPGAAPLPGSDGRPAGERDSGGPSGPRSRRRYLRGRLGKGWLRCAEISDADTKEVFAGKIVLKSLLLKPHQKEKMSMEISIHRSLAHQHVVGFHGFFEDNDFVFVVLELPPPEGECRCWGTGTALASGVGALGTGAGEGRPGAQSC